MCYYFIIITIITEYGWICLNRNSEYAHTKYAKILNLTKFWIWQGSQYGSVSQHSEYPEYSLFDRVLNISWVLNMPVFWIWKLGRVLNMSQYSWICLDWTWICLKMSEFMINRLLNMYHTIHSHSTS